MAAEALTPSGVQHSSLIFITLSHLQRRSDDPLFLWRRLIIIYHVLYRFTDSLYDETELELGQYYKSGYALYSISSESIR